MCVEACLNNQVIFAGRVSLPEAEVLPSFDNELALENDLSLKLPFFADLFDLSMEMLLVDRMTGCVVKLRGNAWDALVFQFHFDLTPPSFDSDELVARVSLHMPEEAQLIDDEGKQNAEASRDAKPGEPVDRGGARRVGRFSPSPPTLPSLPWAPLVFRATLVMEAALVLGHLSAFILERLD